MFEPSTIRDLFMKPFDKANPLTALQQSILTNHQEILDLNRDQLDAGEDAEGNDLGDYSDWYANIKGRRAPIDLKQSGDYRDNMYLVIDENGTDVRSHDRKEDELNLY